MKSGVCVDGSNSLCGDLISDKACQIGWLRIPIDAVHRLGRLKGHDTPAVIIVVYGNRAYEDALLELKDLAVEEVLDAVGSLRERRS